MKLPSIGKKTGSVKAPDGPPKDGRPKAPKTGGRGAVSLSKIGHSLLLGALLVLGLFAATTFYFERRQASAVRDAEVLVRAEQVADQLAGHLTDIGARMDVLTSTSGALAKVLAAGQDAERQALASRWAAAFPGIWALRILPADVIGTDDSLDPPFGYAALDMVNRSLRTAKPVPAEVHGKPGKGASIALLRPIVGKDGRVDGHLMALYRRSELIKWMSAARGFPGKLELVQAISRGRDLSLMSEGSIGDEPAVEQTIAVPGSSWRLVVAADPSESAFPVQAAVLLGGMVVVALVLSAFLIYSSLGRYRNALRSDLATIKRFLDGRETGSVDEVKVRVDELRETFSALWQTDIDSSFLGTEDLATEAGVDLDLELVEDDLDELPAEPVMPVELPVEIFRAYDIRGQVGKDFTADIVAALGRAFGSEAYEQGEQMVVVGRDGRNSSAELAAAMIAGLRASGRDVKDIGLVPTPVLYFGTHFLGSKSGMMLTGSHNPPEYNGIKMVLGGAPLAGPALHELRERLRMGNLLGGQGEVEETDIVPDYISRVASDINVERPLQLVVDCGNGSASKVAPALLRELGCDVSELFCEIDGDFPNHHPDPSEPKNLESLKQEVIRTGADLGLAFDGDGDRLGVIASDGSIIWPDRLMMLFAEDVLVRNPGAIVAFDVKSSAQLAEVIQQRGGRPLMVPSGHSHMKARMKETGALLGGEFSGHIVFKERWFGFDDALYSAARLVELLSFDPRTSAELFEEYPKSLATPELHSVTPEGRNFAIMDALAANPDFGAGNVKTIDGLRAEYPDGWGLVRASNTSPNLTFRFEAVDKSALRRIQDKFRARVLEVDPSIALPF